MPLYTSLVRLKQALNGGTLQPMTPVPVSARGLIDPAFTIGLGALTEDPELGLRCPVRSCGRFFHHLGQHLYQVHADVGGTLAVRRALSIPFGVGLVSRRVSEELSARNRERFAADPHALTQLRDHGRAAANLPRGPRRARWTIATRNFKNRCSAQLCHRLIDLDHELGRPASLNEATAKLGKGVIHSILNVFGSWNSARAQAGLVLQSGPCAYTRDAVLEALSAWYEAHGSLPTSQSAQRPNRTPAIPERAAILRALGTRSWPDAMQRAAALLNVYGGRYGLPVTRQAQTELAASA